MDMGQKFRKEANIANIVEIAYNKGKKAKSEEGFVQALTLDYVHILVPKPIRICKTVKIPYEAITDFRVFAPN